MTPLTFVINSSNPELDYLAMSLCREGRLATYLRRYADKRRWIERALEKMPGMGKLYSRSFGRRRLPEGLDAGRVKSAGVPLEFTAAVLPYVAPKSWASPMARRFVPWIDEALAAEAGKIARTDLASVFVGNYNISYRAFAHARKHGKTVVLNYPIAHHRFTATLLEEEADLQPDFASTIRGPFHSAARIARENQEFQLAHRILVGSSFVKQTFVWAGVPEEKIEVIPYGADTSLFEPPQSRQECKQLAVMYAGQLSQRKGISYLLKAFQEFRGPGSTLTIAGARLGDPGMLTPYEDLFTYLGHLNRPALAERFRQSDVFVFPTLIEGMPLTVLEAMATGLPVITTSHGPGDLVRDGVDGFIVPIRDHRAIVEKLTYLRENPGRRLEMGRNARLRSLDFTWDQYGARALEALRAIANPQIVAPANHRFPASIMRRA